MIPEHLLREYGATIKTFLKQEIVFKENTRVHQYYQIVSGKIKFSSLSKDGKEVLQNIFIDNQCFGETFVFLDHESPVSATALSNTSVFTLSKRSFFRLLKDHPTYSYEINKMFAQRLFYKMKLAQHLTSIRPDERLIALMDFLKYSNPIADLSNVTKIPLTRQQMADFTGLTVETVIRTIKNLEKIGVVSMEDHKIFY